MPKDVPEREIFVFAQEILHPETRIYSNSVNLNKENLFKYRNTKADCS